MSLSSVKVIRATVVSIVLLFILAILSLTLPRISPVSAGVNVCTWTGSGADNNWSTAGNWSCDNGTLPDDGYELIFPYIGIDQVSVNDLSASYVYTDISFTGEGSGLQEFEDIYTLSGNDIRLAGDIVVFIESAIYHSINIENNIVLESESIFNAGQTGNDVNLRIQGVLDLGAHDLTTSTIIPGVPTYSNQVRLGDMSGSGNVTATGNLDLSGDSPLFTGNISMNNGVLFTNSAGAPLSASNTVTLNDQAHFNTCDINIPANFVLIGEGRVTGYNSHVPKLRTSRCAGGPAQGDEQYAYSPPSNSTAEFSGSITLNNNVDVYPQGRNMLLSGPITGSFEIQISFDEPAANEQCWFCNSGDILNIASSDNQSLTPNGEYRLDERQVTLTDNEPTVSIGVGSLHRVFVNGSRGDVYMSGGGILSGTGSVGTIHSFYGVGTIAPGLSPGVLSTGSLEFGGDTTLEIEIGGTEVGEYDQLDVTGTVTLEDFEGNSPTLDVSFWDGFVPSQDDAFIIIQNDGTDAVTGTFDGLAEGATFIVDDVTFQISYVGGSGNDVVLTVTDAPGPPDTGFMTLQASTLLPILAMVSGASALGVRRLSGIKSRKNKK